jgi:hypothetical protein
MEDITGLELTPGDAPLPCAGAVPIAIDYCVLRECVASWEKANDIVFSRKIDSTPIKVGVAIAHEQPVSLDPYKVRADFEKADSEVSVRRFLNSAGPFWRRGQVRLSQFREWQAFVKLIRRDDFLQLAAQDPEAQQAALALNSFPNTFFHFDHPDDLAEIQRIQTDHPEFRASFDEARNWHEQQRRELLAYFASPTIAVHSCYTPEAIKRLKGEGKRPAWPPTNSDTMPIIVYKPRNVLECIAATISADRLQGIAHRACQGCGSLFLRAKESQKYCGGTACKDKARTARRTKESHKVRDFYCSRRAAGLEISAIRQMASAEGLKITDRDVERAEKALARMDRQ